MLYPFNYGNKCRIFGLFSLLGSGCHVYESNHLRDELSQLLYIDFSLFANSKILLCLTKWSALSCPLGGACYIHLTMGTNAVFSGFFSLFGHGNQLYELNHFRDESSDFLFRHFYMLLFQSDSLLPLFRFHGFNHGCFLEVTPIRFVTQKTVP